MLTQFPVIIGLAVALLGAFGLGAVGAVQDDDDAERRELKGKYEFKEFRWVAERAGDCHMSGILTIFSNGRAVWTASTKTDSTTNRDIWHASLEVRDASNRRLFGFGVWDSPFMYDEGHQYNWRKSDTFPAGFFRDAATATADGEC